MRQYDMIVFAYWSGACRPFFFHCFFVPWLHVSLFLICVINENTEQENLGYDFVNGWIFSQLIGCVCIMFPRSKICLFYHADGYNLSFRMYGLWQQVFVLSITWSWILFSFYLSIRIGSTDIWEFWMKKSDVWSHDKTPGAKVTN